MPTQIFNNKYQNADIWDLQGAVITFGTEGDINKQSTNWDTVIAVSLQLGYGRQVGQRYPINIRRVIYTLGVPSGTLTIGMLFGPNDALTKFFNMFGGGKAEDSMLGTANSIIKIKPFGTVMGTTGGTTKGSFNSGIWTINNPVLNNVGLTVQETGSSTIPVSGNVSMTFQDLQYGA